MQKKRQSQQQQPPIPAALSAEVKAAVDDIMSGTTMDSATEWLQREYARLMHREAQYRRNNPTPKPDENQGKRVIYC